MRLAFVSAVRSLLQLHVMGNLLSITFLYTSRTLDAKLTDAPFVFTAATRVKTWATESLKAELKNYFQVYGSKIKLKPVIGYMGRYICPNLRKTVTKIVLS